MNDKYEKKLLNKLKFIERINGYDKKWFYQYGFTCSICKFNGDNGCGIRDKQQTALIYSIKNHEIKTISLTMSELGNSCVEFLRSPKEK